MNEVVLLFNKYAIFFVGALILIEAATLAMLLKINKKVKNIFRGKTLNIDDVLIELRQNQEEFAKHSIELDDRLIVVEKNLPTDLRRVGLKRFNSFSDGGGEQSFALAL